MRKSATSRGIERWLTALARPAAAPTMPTIRSFSDVVDDPLAALGHGQHLGQAASSTSNTSTPRSRIDSQKASCSSLARFTQMHVVEQQVRGVRRREPRVLEARAGGPSPCAACRPLSARRMPSLPPRLVERAQRSSIRCLRRSSSRSCRAVPSSISSMSVSPPMPALPPVGPSEVARRDDLRAHGARRELLGDAP